MRLEKDGHPDDGARRLRGMLRCRAGRLGGKGCVASFETNGCAHGHGGTANTCIYIKVYAHTRARKTHARAHHSHCRSILHITGISQDVQLMSSGSVFEKISP